ncbi:MAG: hypothetical protein LBG92_09745 [Prevotellaceae bacterium]|jgi:IS30 family transposase|nr:hypothetical protein [Prevotellaceae bacterium]
MKRIDLGTVKRIRDLSMKKMSTRKIAERLKLNLRTVQKYCKDITQKRAMQAKMAKENNDKSKKVKSFSDSKTEPLVKPALEFDKSYETMKQERYRALMALEKAKQLEARAKVQVVRVDSKTVKLVKINKSNINKKMKNRK